MKIIIACIVAAIIAFGISFGLGYIVIPFLHKIKFGQTILDIGPKWHKNKQGTPTMGGILFIVGTVVAFGVVLVIDKLLGGNIIEMNDIVADSMRVKIYGGLIMALGFAFIGFLDDYIKVVKKRNLGLTARQKTFLQLFVSALFLFAMFLFGMKTVWIPFLGEFSVDSGFGLIFWPVALLFIYGFTNAVNLTDGVDGLAASVTMVVCCFMMLTAGYLENWGYNALSAACAGACVGFLVWNAHPAKVFMGDTGSMFLGGMVVGVSFGINKPIILIVAGIIYFAEALSVMLQVTYFKLTGKRIFKMSPLHHHFEMSGWSEEKVVIVFSLVAFLGSALGLAAVIFG